MIISKKLFNRYVAQTLPQAHLEQYRGMNSPWSLHPGDRGRRICGGQSGPPQRETPPHPLATELPFDRKVKQQAARVRKGLR
jgi:hypothetical protein